MDNNCKYLCLLRVSKFARFQNMSTSVILQGPVKSNLAVRTAESPTPPHAQVPASSLPSKLSWASALPLRKPTGGTKTLMPTQLSSALPTTVLNDPEPCLCVTVCGTTVPSTQISLAP